MNFFKPTLILLAIAAPAALCSDLQLTGVGTNGTLAGVYIGPYQGLVDGVPTPIICDDFSAETFVDETWTANSFTFADLADPNNLQQTRWGGAGFTLTDYQQAAWLAMQLSNYPALPSSACGLSDQCAGDIQFAIWSKFDPAASAQLAAQAGGHLPFVQTWLDRAAAEYGNYDYSNFQVFTPAAREGAPQEFIIVKTPEPSEVALLCIELSSAIGLAFFVRRRKTSVK